jgi:carbonic anhydrase
MPQIPAFSTAPLVQPSHTGALERPAHGRAALLTCMHGTLDCAALTGRLAREAQIIRNAGARLTDEGVRSFLLAYELLGVRSWLIVQHSDCGLALLDGEVTENLWPSLSEARPGRGWTRADRAGSAHGAALGRLLLQDRAQLLAADVSRLRAHALRPSDVSVHGYLLDEASGELHEV